MLIVIMILKAWLEKNSTCGDHCSWCGDSW